MLGVGASKIRRARLNEQASSKEDEDPLSDLLRSASGLAHHDEGSQASRQRLVLQNLLRAASARSPPQGPRPPPPVPHTPHSFRQQGGYEESVALEQKSSVKSSDRRTHLKEPS